MIEHHAECVVVTTYSVQRDTRANPYCCRAEQVGRMNPAGSADPSRSVQLEFRFDHQLA